MKKMAEGADDIKVEMRQFNLITMDSLIEGQKKMEERKKRKREEKSFLSEDLKVECKS